MSYRTFVREQPIESAFGVGTTLSTSFGQTYFISLFVPSLVVALPISEAEFGSLYGIGTLLGALLLPFIATHYDRRHWPPTRGGFFGPSGFQRSSSR